MKNQTLAVFSEASHRAFRRWGVWSAEGAACFVAAARVWGWRGASRFLPLSPSWAWARRVFARPARVSWAALALAAWGRAA